MKSKFASFIMTILMILIISILGLFGILVYQEIYNEDIQVVDNQIEKEYEDILDLFGSELIEMEG